MKLADQRVSMNKAFVREADSDVRHCPFCGSLGQAVGKTTLDHWLKPESRGQLGESAMFCPHTQCHVAYFDSFERLARVDELMKPAYPKSAEAPICGCFGLMCAEIEEDVAEGGVLRTRAAVERAKSSEARCSLMAANGQSCVTEVQRYFFKCRGGMP